MQHVLGLAERAVSAGVQHAQTGVILDFDSRSALLRAVSSDAKPGADWFIAYDSWIMPEPYTWGLKRPLLPQWASDPMLK